MHYYLGWERWKSAAGGSQAGLSQEERTQQRFDEEVLAYAEEFLLIFGISRREMESTTHAWMKYYSVANDAARQRSDQSIRNNLIQAYFRVHPDLTSLRSVITEGKKWAAYPGNLENPAQLATVEAAADRALTVLNELAPTPAK